MSVTIGDRAKVTDVAVAADPYRRTIRQGRQLIQQLVMLDRVAANEGVRGSRRLLGPALFQHVSLVPDDRRIAHVVRTVMFRDAFTRQLCKAQAHLREGPRHLGANVKSHGSVDRVDEGVVGPHHVVQALKLRHGPRVEDVECPVRSIGDFELLAVVDEVAAPSVDGPDG